MGAMGLVEGTPMALEEQLRKHVDFFMEVLEARAQSTADYIRDNLVPEIERTLDAASSCRAERAVVGIARLVRILDAMDRQVTAGDELLSDPGADEVFKGARLEVEFNVLSTAAGLLSSCGRTGTN